ncbi:hypothetical protein A2631_00845 [Candidatus Daviesbacteria bacterium RIFCSPHIGHO2_01_FULL_44_29]|uniref:Uncharacterized protein n=1 Tax=Candidatus Daviesbacteria bacterium RIFCSPHIGHO2_02_FULL_43_12 TaxID=1797776 RepID=A0A1F5KH55_9BACT|nr:MAG: hypothetical protein A2631_00845 [Candidatus Daviesbacteria bacterium RIFCSPHIGHO2_01_FULL_44_29]OGE39293.1 MAG: hypothetical protein A3E86_00605 [Candidatus Daviesbacteria bacterium RIFCSPHIGHO2_12_FULL_47_45]OGE40267.1 MAG: hypothetical protein A3D25_05310 [Candidatus Daviesbacteria bacterium RIFCSPHIGHO2_02_FULL_43_12]OGE69066.1 MAG: hypothetical protein A3B55_02390 [Candidatus Daviesbacteria bacterium RIFCSPLOWO2_01_FULL_43_15]
MTDQREGPAVPERPNLFSRVGAALETCLHPNCLIEGAASAAGAILGAAYNPDNPLLGAAVGIFTGGAAAFIGRESVQSMMNENRVRAATAYDQGIVGLVDRRPSVQLLFQALKSGRAQTPSGETQPIDDIDRLNQVRENSNSSR